MTFSPIKKASAVFDVLEAQGIEFPSAPTRVEVDNNGTVRIDMNMDNITAEAREQFRALLPVEFEYHENKFAYRAFGNLLGIRVVFRFYVDTQAYEEGW